MASEASEAEKPELSRVPSEGKPDATVPIACDVCYSRKVRCDRKTPCGNCVDSGVACRRQRPKLERKTRELYPKDTADAINELKADMAALKNSVSYLIALSTKPKSEPSNSGDPPRKRAYRDAFGKSLSGHTTPPRRHSPCIAAGSEAHPTFPFSAYEARSLIQEELGRIPRSSTSKHEAFRCALSSLKQNLNTSIIDHDSPNALTSGQPLETLRIPDVTLMQWMIQSNDSGRPVCSGTEFMPFTSRNTIKRMVRNLPGKPEASNLASLICVSSYAGYFLQEIVLSDKRKYTGLEDELRLQAVQCFATARAAISRTLLQAPSTLENLQALTYGVGHAQESGDFVSAWLLTEQTAKMCIDLKLHKKVNAFTNCSPAEAFEIYYCFAICYKNDKGLAMNLARPPFLHDSEIETDLLRPPNAKEEVVDNFRIYIELAKIQSRIITDLRPAKGSDREAGLMSEILVKMDLIWRLNEEVQNGNRKMMEGKYDTELESTMVDFAFYSLKTVAFHSSGERLRNLVYYQASLEAARLALQAVQKTRELSRLSQYNSTYMRTSLVSWTILYYPFTPFFILFCNVISTRHIQDYNIMQEFVAYLAEVTDISISVAKLHKLCVPFISLVSGILNLEDGTSFSQEDHHHLTANQNPINITRHHPNPNSWEGPILHPHSITSTSQPQPQQWQIHTPAPPLPYSMVGPIQEVNGNEQGTSLDAVNPDINRRSGSESFAYGDQYLWEFMDTQPVLQWLDSDFSAFDDPWAGFVGNGS